MALLLLLAGCSDRGRNPPPDDPPAPPAAISPDELRAAEYPADLLDRARVRLRDGAFAPADSGREAMESMALHPTVGIAEPRDGVARAAAVTLESGGGTGMFYWLHLLERTTGPPRVVASAYLGDRIDLVSLGFAGDTLVTRLVIQGPTDAACCPTLEVERRYLRAGEDLVEVKGGK